MKEISKKFYIKNEDDDKFFRQQLNKYIHDILESNGGLPRFGECIEIDIKLKMLKQEESVDDEIEDSKPMEIELNFIGDPDELEIHSKKLIEEYEEIRERLKKTGGLL